MPLPIRATWIIWIETEQPFSTHLCCIYIIYYNIYHPSPKWRRSAKSSAQFLPSSSTKSNSDVLGLTVGSRKWRCFFTSLGDHHLPANAMEKIWKDGDSPNIFFRQRSFSSTYCYFRLGSRTRNSASFLGVVLYLHYSNEADNYFQRAGVTPRKLVKWQSTTGWNSKIPPESW